MEYKPWTNINPWIVYKILSITFLIREGFYPYHNSFSIPLMIVITMIIIFMVVPLFNMIFVLLVSHSTYWTISWLITTTFFAAYSYSLPSTRTRTRTRELMLYSYSYSYSSSTVVLVLVLVLAVLAPSLRPTK